MKYKPIYVSPIYTGGGVYVYLGTAEDENGKSYAFFGYDDCFCGAGILSEDPKKLPDSEMEKIWDYEWESTHTIRELCDAEGMEFVMEMYDWIIENQPNDHWCNYALYEILDRKNRQEEKRVL